MLTETIKWNGKPGRNVVRSPLTYDILKETEKKTKKNIWKGDDARNE